GDRGAYADVAAAFLLGSGLGAVLDIVLCGQRHVACGARESDGGVVGNRRRGLAQPDVDRKRPGNAGVGAACARRCFCGETVRRIAPVEAMLRARAARGEVLEPCRSARFGVRLAVVELDLVALDIDVISAALGEPADVGAGSAV